MAEVSLPQESLFLEAVEITSPAQRAAFLDQACGDDRQLRADVEGLLRAHERSGDMLDLPEHSASAVDEPVLERAGTSIGPYRLLEQVGEGGFGVVFLAEQTEPVRRQVALKVLKPGMDTRQVVARFEAERQALAIMDHPNIAKIFDGGVSPSGRPFFVMELVQGTPITDYCDQHQLTPRERLELFILVCQAVQHAHQKGIIHRDLKPSNILVQAKGERDKAKAEQVDSAVPFAPCPFACPKVIDFGVAKALSQGLTNETLHTAVTQMIGTPIYMSPEQAGLSDHDIDTRSDIYSLGVLLYDLLTGTTPFTRERFSKSAYDEICRIIREEEPPKPSDRVRELENERAKEGQRGGSRTLPRFHSLTRKEVRGDLDWVVMKCLEKAPPRRYASAGELADDVGRFLRSEPIRARPASVRYRLGKWVRRKPALAALLAVSVVSLATLTLGSLAYNARLRAEVQRADGNADEARQQQARADAGYRAASDTLNRMLGRLEARRVGEAPQLKELQRELLEDALAFYRGHLDGADSVDPVVRRDTALACKRAAHIELVLGQAAAAAQNYQRAIDLVKSLPAEHRDALENQTLQADCSNGLGMVANHVGRWDEAERHHWAARAIYARLAEDRPDDWRLQDGLALCENDLAIVCQFTGRQAEAVDHYSRAVTIRTRLVHDHPREERIQAALAENHLNLGLLCSKKEAFQNYEEAVALLRPLVERHPQAGDYALSLAGAYNNWGELLRQDKRLPDALDRQTQAVDLAEAVLLQEPQYAFARVRAYNTHGARAQVYEALGRFADAAKDWDRVVELDDRPDPWVRRALRAVALARAGDHTRATTEAQTLEQDPAVNAEGLYTLAVAYAQAIEAARSDARLAPSERTERSERYAASAIALLQKLQARNYFQDARNLKQLKTDPDLRSLHGRAEFQRLLTGGDAKSPNS